MIIRGDSKTIPLADCSVDAVITDPPYGLSFMGKRWDKAVPSVELWREVFRVMKPGAFAAILCTPRQDCQARMILNLEEAGFVTGFTSILWTYATGFPKAANLSKLADKRAGAEREVVGVKHADRYPNGPGGSGFHGGPGEYSQVDRGPEMETTPATPEAKALDGAYAGFQPKPAVEIVLIAMKPLSEPTYLDQALDNGKGCSWLDDGRIPAVKGDPNERGHGYGFNRAGYKKGSVCNWGFNKSQGWQPSGRFPANVLSSDNVLDDGRVSKSPRSYVRNVDNGWTGDIYGDGACKEVAGSVSYNHADSGSYSRYFDLDAWFAERIASLPESVRKVYPWLIVPKPSKREKNAGLSGRRSVTVGDGRQKSIDNPFQRGETERVNSHVSVKPVRLMSYLIAIFSRPGELILDPFAGSGTTAVSARIMDRHHVGIELDPEYAAIAQSRERHAEYYDSGSMAYELSERPAEPKQDARQVNLFEGGSDEDPTR